VEVEQMVLCLLMLKFLDVLHSHSCIPIIDSCVFMSKLVLKMAWHWSRWSLSIVEF